MREEVCEFPPGDCLRSLGETTQPQRHSPLPVWEGSGQGCRGGAQPVEGRLAARVGCCVPQVSRPAEQGQGALVPNAWTSNS